jgi:hypothetical protein
MLLYVNYVEFVYCWLFQSLQMSDKCKDCKLFHLFPCFHSGAKHNLDVLYHGISQRAQLELEENHRNTNMNKYITSRNRPNNHMATTLKHVYNRFIQSHVHKCANKEKFVRGIFLCFWFALFDLFFL